MASEEEERSSKGFKVQDRRRFSAEGELKPEFSGTEEPPASPRPAGGPAASPRPPSGRAVSPDAHQHAAAPGPQHAAAAEGYAAARSTPGTLGTPSEERGAGEINFAAFLMSLSTEALVHLGEMADPASGQAHRDLPMAQQLIDILGMLRDKTRGNLDHNEQSLLDAILFDLRMKYVEIARRSG
jgi:Domain of unknown function (DUF1844)